MIPVILISEKSIGDRGDELRTIANTFIEITNNYSELFESVQFLFTKFNTEKGKKNLIGKLVNI